MQDIRRAIKYLEESKCEQKQGDEYQRRHDDVLDLAINALEKKDVYENKIWDIQEWFEDNKGYLIKKATKMASQGYEWKVDINGFTDNINLDVIVEDIVGEVHQAVMDILNT